jgi:hypothetical protein
MTRITKRCVTFNKYAKIFNFLNKMKTTITLPHTHAALCLSQLLETHRACIYIKWNPWKENALICIIDKQETAVPQKKWNLRHTTRRMSHDKFSTRTCNRTAPATNRSCSQQFEIAAATDHIWAAAKAIVWLATLLTPVVNGRKHLLLHPVDGTCNHVQKSLTVHRKRRFENMIIGLCSRGYSNDSCHCHRT